MSHRKIIPEEIAQTPRELREKFALLKIGMNFKQVGAILSDDQREPVDLYNTPNVMNITDGNEKGCVIYRCFATLSSDQEEFVRNSQVFLIRLVDAETSFVIKPWKLGADFSTVGPDLKAYLIFDKKNGALVEMRDPDKILANEGEGSTVWSVIDTVGQSGASRAGRRITSIP